MKLRLIGIAFLVLCSFASLASAEPVSLDALHDAIFAAAPAGQQKATCTQTACPGGGSVTCTTDPGFNTCQTKCGGVKCAGQDFKYCTNPCCTRTVTCWDGSTYTCKNWKLNDCSTSAQGVQCDGICPPPDDPCLTNPLLCNNNTKSKKTGPKG